MLPKIIASSGDKFARADQDESPDRGSERSYAGPVVSVPHIYPLNVILAYIEIQVSSKNNLVDDSAQVIKGSQKILNVSE